MIEKQTTTKDAAQAVVVKEGKDELPLFTGCSLWRDGIDITAPVLLNGVGAILQSPPWPTGSWSSYPRDRPQTRPGQTNVAWACACTP
jgi:hypothetical protein